MVPGVKVEATHVATNCKYTTTSNEAGQYTLVNIREGAYTVRATAGGFREFVVQSVKLELGQLETAIEVMPACADHIQTARRLVHPHFRRKSCY
jgi:hypothetical protein